MGISLFKSLFVIIDMMSYIFYLHYFKIMANLRRGTDILDVTGQPYRAVGGKTPMQGLPLGIHLPGGSPARRTETSYDQNAVVHTWNI